MTPVQLFFDMQAAERARAEKLLPDGITDQELIAVLESEGITIDALERLLAAWRAQLEKTAQ